MAWALSVIGVLVVMVSIVMFIGARLPRDHVAAVRVRLTAPPDTVWALLADPYSATSWRKDVRKIVRIPDIGGHEAWAETTSSGVITFELIESTPPLRRVTRIADASLPFGGQWEHDLAPSGTGTELTVTERGFVKPALFRFMARYVFGYTSTINDYLVALGAKLGAQVVPEVTVSGR